MRINPLIILIIVGAMLVSLLFASAEGMSISTRGLAVSGVLLVATVIVVAHAWPVGEPLVSSPSGAPEAKGAPEGSHVAVLTAIRRPGPSDKDWPFDRLYSAAVSAPKEGFSDVTVRTSDLAEILRRVDEAGLRRT